jgi:hypothetical protein
VADLNILEMLFGGLSGTTPGSRTLEQRETLRAEPTRRIPFTPIQGTGSGIPVNRNTDPNLLTIKELEAVGQQPRGALDPRNVPVDLGGPRGELETMGRIKGFASDDPGGFAGKLEARSRGLSRREFRSLEEPQLREFLFR